jgi:hypothetical protein
MKNIPTQQEVINLLKTGRIDEYGHLLITNKTYRSYCNWFINTLNDHNKKSMMDIKKISPSKFKSIVCNIIAASFTSVTEWSPIKNVCVHYTNGSYDLVNI